MAAILQMFLNIFRFHKKKIVFLIGSIAFWGVVLFPYNDLSDYVTQLISKQTQNQVYLQFEGLSLGLMPQLGLVMKDVIVESAMAPSISMDSLGVAPKLSAIFGIPAAKAKAYGVFGGDAVADVGPSNELEIKGTELNLNISLSGVELKELGKYVKEATRTDLNMSGKTNVTTSLYVDPSFAKQPQGQVEVKIAKLDVPSRNLSFNFQGAPMSMPLPAFKISNISLRGSLKDGILNIKEGKIGSGDKKDNLYGDVTGELEMRVLKGGRVDLTGYNLRIDLNISENLRRQLGPMLGFVEKFQSKSMNGVRIGLRAKARSMQTFPQLLEL